MNTFDTRQKLKTLLAQQLGISEQEIGEYSTLRDLGADSIDRIEIALEIESPSDQGGFGLQIPDRDMDEFVTFGDLLRYITAHAS